MRRYTYTVLLGPRDRGGYRATCPALPGCRAYGSTKKETIQNIKLSISHRLDRLENSGKPIPRDSDLA